MSFVNRCRLPAHQSWWVGYQLAVFTENLNGHFFASFFVQIHQSAELNSVGMMTFMFFNQWNRIYTTKNTDIFLLSTYKAGLVGCACVEFNWNKILLYCIPKIIYVSCQYHQGEQLLQSLSSVDNCILK